MKRLFDFVVSLFGLIVVSPILLPVMFLVWKQDGHSPFYIALRVGKEGKLFNMVKLRSMMVNADKSGVDSTASTDSRITVVGAFIRKFKLDELMQLWNVLVGDMSLVGPRPNVKRETDLYTSIELEILHYKPGITDLASIVFSDEGEILAGKEDPDIAYNQLIRPWKSRLALFYVKNRKFFFDLRIIVYTLISIISRKTALACVVWELSRYGASAELVNVAKRISPLKPYPPPGAMEIITAR